MRKYYCYKCKKEIKEEMEVLTIGPFKKHLCKNCFVIVKRKVLEYLDA